MNKIISICMILFLLLSFTSCKSSVNTEMIYNENKADLEQIVTYFGNNENIREITTDNPGLFYDYPYINCDGVYYITQTKTDIQKNDETENINQTVKDNFVCVVYEKDENVVVFQTIAEFGYGEYIIYTESGEPYSDKTFSVSKQLNSNWYIAATN